MAKTKKVPLAERVTWQATGPHSWEFTLGEYRVQLFRLKEMRETRWWKVAWSQRVAHWDGDVTFPQPEFDAAQAEALRIVQRAVLKAAEAWRDDG